ncbi:MAG: TonB-dependent receptor domain-containing protein, partial [Bacteroidota bacterium]
GKTYELANYGQLYRTLIRDWSCKTDFTWYVSAPLIVRWGVSWTNHNFQPGVITANFLQPGQTGSNVDSLASILLNNEKLGARETDGYVEGEWEFSRHFRLEAGINTAYFQVRDADYTVNQPRLRIIRKGDKGWSQWAGYHKTAQFLHQIGTFNISLPFELWVPSTSKAPPELVDQYSAGISKQGKGWNWQAELYYKSFNRVLTFISSGDALYTGGAVDASGWEDRIASGTGTSRGIEITIEKLLGKTRGSIVYTLSNSDRLFPDLNSGRPFPFRFDRLHDLKITARQELTDWLEADVIWGFATGNPITLTGVKFRHESVEGEVQREVFFYTEVNGYRLPVYHRLDLALNARWGNRNIKHTLQLGTYNTYNRANPFYLYIDAGSSVKGKAIQFTLLPLLPVFRYEIKF